MPCPRRSSSTWLTSTMKMIAPMWVEGLILPYSSSRASLVPPFSKTSAVVDMAFELKNVALTMRSCSSEAIIIIKQEIESNNFK